MFILVLFLGLTSLEANEKGVEQVSDQLESVRISSSADDVAASITPLPGNKDQIQIHTNGSLTLTQS